MPLQLRPLLAGENEVDIKLSCAELGEYVYKLKLSATAAGPEGGMHFSTDLGGLQPQKFRFKSYRKAPTTYTCSVEDEDFEGDVKVDAPAAEDDNGVEAEVNVTFEPSKLGVTHATMVLKSAEGGDYIVNLHGECVPPKPKGPFDVKGSFNMPFKDLKGAANDVFYVFGRDQLAQFAALVEAHGKNHSSLQDVHTFPFAVHLMSPHRYQAETDWPQFWPERDNPFYVLWRRRRFGPQSEAAACAEAARLGVLSSNASCDAYSSAMGPSAPAPSLHARPAHALHSQPPSAT